MLEEQVKSMREELEGLKQTRSLTVRNRIRSSLAELTQKTDNRRANQVIELEKKIAEKDKELAVRDERIKALEREVDALKSQIEDLQRELDHLRSMLHSKGASLADQLSEDDAQKKTRAKNLLKKLNSGGTIAKLKVPHRRQQSDLTNLSPRREAQDPRKSVAAGQFMEIFHKRQKESSEEKNSLVRIPCF